MHVPLILSIECYIATGLGISEEPITNADCIDFFETTRGKEDQFFAGCTNEELVNNQMACAVECQGSTRDSARCDYTCERHAVCVILNDMSQRLSTRDATNFNQISQYALKKPVAPLYGYRHHKCCQNSFCNKSASSHVQAATVFIFAAAAACLLVIMRQ